MTPLVLLLGGREERHERATASCVLDQAGYEVAGLVKREPGHEQLVNLGFAARLELGLVAGLRNDTIRLVS